MQGSPTPTDPEMNTEIAVEASHKRPGERRDDKR
jgi:hypothetical protein